MLSDFNTTSQALQLLDQISTSAGLNISLNKKAGTLSEALRGNLTKKAPTNNKNGLADASDPSVLPVVACMEALVKLEFRHKALGDCALPLTCTLGQVRLGAGWVAL